MSFYWEFTIQDFYCILLCINDWVADTNEKQPLCKCGAEIVQTGPKYSIVLSNGALLEGYDKKMYTDPNFTFVQHANQHLKRMFVLSVFFRSV